MQISVANADFGNQNELGQRNGKFRRVIGHEGVGRVSKLAEGASDYLKIGDRVSIAWFFDACGVCDYCVTGNETFCRKVRNSGYTIDVACTGSKPSGTLTAYLAFTTACCDIAPSIV